MRAALPLAIALSAVLVSGGAHAQLTTSGCGRPTDPGGLAGYDYGAATVQTFGNDTVLVWYTTTGPYQVNTYTTRADNVPNDVADVAQVTSDALASYASMGYRAPVSDSVNPTCGSNGGDGRLDVYLVSMDGADGMTAAESGRCTSAGAASRCASFIFAQSNFAVYYQTSDIGIHTVLPHETFHTVQNAYDANLDRFWAEGTAQWAAKTLDPSLTDLERFLPAFFSATGRALDSPPDGVVSAFLYGAAIWPVFLTQRHGDTIVRKILETEGKAGGPALAATDSVLRDEGSSMADEYPRFAAWNAATGTRAGDAGYAEATTYPMLTVGSLDGGKASGITSSFASFYYRVSSSAAATVTLTTDPARNAGMLVPLSDGIAHVGRVSTLPATLDGDGIAVVSGITSNKTDGPFSVSIVRVVDAAVVDAAASSDDAAASSIDATASSDDSLAASGCGCSLSAHRSGFETGGILILLFTFIAVARRRTTTGASRFRSLHGRAERERLGALSGIDGDTARLVTGFTSMILFPVTGALYVGGLLDVAAYEIATLTSLTLLTYAVRPTRRRADSPSAVADGAAHGVRTVRTSSLIWSSYSPPGSAVALPKRWLQ